MLKKRKPHRKKKIRFLLSRALLFLAIAFVIFSYLYRTNPQFKEKTDALFFTATSSVRQIFVPKTHSERADERTVQQDKSQEAPPEKKYRPENVYSTEHLVTFVDGMEKPRCLADKHDANHEIRAFSYYSLCYRESYEQAEWSAYCLTDSQLEKNAGRTDNFRADPLISTGSATLSDYRGSGYDRGHLTPAADMAFSKESMSETFFMSNMSPQTPQFNRGIWKELEAETRRWVQKFGRAYIVSGPILDKTPDAYKKIGKNEVSVPEFYYKVILVPLYSDETDRQTPENADSATAIGFIIPNTECNDSFFAYAVSVDEVEQRTGIDFFPLLEDSVERRVESEKQLDKWTQ